tara:strand:+ start:1722 stop:2141 length:420 start_codon:yes stop_codon:yes gene_type:complete
MIDDIETNFNAALSRYQAGDNLNDVIHDFETITKQIPNHFAAWTCLAWLHLLLKNNDEGLFSAKQAVRLNGQDPQARMNLSLALLATKNKGVRDHIELIKRIILMAPELEDDLKSSIEDGLKRNPDWSELKKIKKWLDF